MSGTYALRSIDDIPPIVRALRENVADDTVVEISKAKKRRTSNQNSTMHMWFGEISSATGATAAEIKEDLKRELLGMEDHTTVTGMTTSRIRATSGLTKAQCIEFMERIQAMAAEWGWGITQPMPDVWRKWADDAMEDPDGQGALR